MKIILLNMCSKALDNCRSFNIAAIECESWGNVFTSSPTPLRWLNRNRFAPAMTDPAIVSNVRPLIALLRDLRFLLSAGWGTGCAEAHSSRWHAFAVLSAVRARRNKARHFPRGAIAAEVSHPIWKLKR